jgi:hypothetical protein
MSVIVWDEAHAMAYKDISLLTKEQIEENLDIIRAFIVLDQNWEHATWDSIAFRPHRPSQIDAIIEAIRKRQLTEDLKFWIIVMRAIGGSYLDSFNSMVRYYQVLERGG